MRRILWGVAFSLVLVLVVQATLPTFAIAKESESGYSQETMITVSVLSLLLPGLGQYLLKLPSRALTHFLVWIGSWVVGYLLMESTYGISFLLPLIWSIYSAFDAFSIASSR
ncbi:MAG: hypothetical protein N2380_09040 [bacterium]|nr:hypothetical protein [bacterium]